MIRHVLALCVCVAALAGCRVELSVDMVVEPDGTGTITFVATADAEVVAAVPTLADELATDDIVAAGWTIDGRPSLPDGGLTITLSHDSRPMPRRPTCSTASGRRSTRWR